MSITDGLVAATATLVRAARIMVIAKTLNTEFGKRCGESYSWEETSQNMQDDFLNEAAGILDALIAASLLD